MPRLLRDGIYLYGQVRSADWRPVGEPDDYDNRGRGEESGDSEYDSAEEDAYAKLIEGSAREDIVSDDDSDDCDYDPYCMSEEQQDAYAASCLEDQEYARELFTRFRTGYSQIERDFAFP